MVYLAIAQVVRDFGFRGVIKDSQLEALAWLRSNERDFRQPRLFRLNMSREEALRLVNSVPGYQAIVDILEHRQGVSEIEFSKE